MNQPQSKFNISGGAMAIIAIVLCGAGYWAYKTFPNLFNGGSGVDGLDDQIDEAKLSFTDADYSSMKWQLYDELSSTFYADGDVILGIFGRLKNASDYYRLVDEYGVMNGKNLVQRLPERLYESEQHALQTILDKLGVKLFNSASGKDIC